MLSRRQSSNHETVICDLESGLIPASTMNSVDTVYHLAGFAHDAREASTVESIYHTINVEATVKLAELAIRAGVKRFVFVSSVKASGYTIPGQCMTEEDQGEPKEIYGHTKREAEIKLLELCEKSNIHLSIIRPSLAYGPGMKGNLFMMMNGIEKGWFLPLPEVNNRRSMVHVDDLVQALLFVANDDRANGEIFIVTDGNPISSRKIYDAMCGVLNKSIPRWGMPRLLFDVIALMNSSIHSKVNKLLEDECYSSDKLRDLGFRARLSISEINKKSF